jgi:hypothetical protein
MKCAKETRLALGHHRTNNTWVCHQCQAYGEVRARGEAAERIVMGECITMKGLTLLQWNCDYLATKVDELQELADREGADVLVIQETKLGMRDQTPRLKGYNQVRKIEEAAGRYTIEGGD